MRLLSLDTTGLHGSLNFQLKFFSDLNLLVGINGSGKTSALNVIEWLLKPNLAKLATIKFETLQLLVESEGDLVKVLAKKDEELVSLTVAKEGLEFEPITVDLHKWRGRYPDDEDNYKGLQPEKHELPAWELLQSIGQPTLVSLERTLTAEIDDEVYSDTPLQIRAGNSRARSGSTTPLGYVRKILREKYFDFRRQSNINDAELKSKIILAALHSPNAGEPPLPDFRMPQPSTEQLEEKVINYLSDSTSASDVTEHVKRFFEYFRNLSERVEKDIQKSGEVIDLIHAQFDRIDQLAVAFNEFENKNSLAFKDLEMYLNEVNKFLSDSGKEVAIDDRSGRLVFRELSSQFSGHESRSVNLLSSGETQIVILFALAAFESHDGSVFVVDEPELSLHPKWQKDFMESFLKLCGDKSQVIVATHSPEIVGRRKSNCVFL